MENIQDTATNNNGDNLGTSALTPEEAKASLGLATRLSEQHLASQVAPQTPSQSPQEAPGQETGQNTEQTQPEPQENEFETKTTKELETMKTDIELIKKAVVKDTSEESK